MDVALGVHLRHAFGHIVQHGESLPPRPRRRLALKEVGQRAAGHQLDDHEVPHAFHLALAHLADHREALVVFAAASLGLEQHAVTHSVKMEQPRAAQPLHGPDLGVAEAPFFFPIWIAQHQLDRDLDLAAPFSAVDAPFAALRHERFEREVGRRDAPRFLQRADLSRMRLACPRQLAPWVGVALLKAPLPPHDDCEHGDKGGDHDRPKKLING